MKKKATEQLSLSKMTMAMGMSCIAIAISILLTGCFCSKPVGKDAAKLDVQVYPSVRCPNDNITFEWTIEGETVGVEFSIPGDGDSKQILFSDPASNGTKVMTVSDLRAIGVNPASISKIVAISLVAPVRYPEPQQAIAKQEFPITTINDLSTITLETDAHDPVDQPFFTLTLPGGRWSEHINIASMQIVDGCTAESANQAIYSVDKDFGMPVVIQLKRENSYFEEFTSPVPAAGTWKITPNTPCDKRSKRLKVALRAICN